MSAITDKHRAFARAMVALAREYQMDNLRATFRQNFESRRTTVYTPVSHEEITLSWSEGRHGDESNILLECRAAEGIKEKEPQS